MKKTTIIIILSIIMQFTALIAGVAVFSADAKDGPPERVTTITGITIMENSLEIKGDKPFIYTIYKASDPFKVIVEIPDAKLGSFKDAMRSKSAWITEVTPSQVDSPKMLAKVEILLQAPSDFESQYSNNSLIVKAKNPEQGKRSLAYDQVKARMAEVTKEGDPPADQKQHPLQSSDDKSHYPKATEITNVSFDRSDGTVKLIIKGNGSMSPSVFTLKNRIVIDVPDVTSKALIPTEVVSPVKGLRAGKYKDKTRLVVDLDESRDFDVMAVKDTIVVAMKGPESSPAGRKEVTTEAPPLVAEEKKEAAVKEEGMESKEPEALVEGKYVGRKISLDFQDSDIVPIFRLLSDISGYNIVVDPTVRGRLTMKLINVPWDQALDIILRTFVLGKSVEGNIIRIAPAAVLARESDEKAKAKAAEFQTEPLETKVFSVSYGDIEKVRDLIKESKILTARGSISVDRRTSSLVVKDGASVFPAVEELLATLDKQIPQVMIEVRIVEVSSSDSNDLGIQWGGRISAINTLSTFGGYPTFNTGSFTGNPFLVDFPSSTAGKGAGSGFSFGIMNAAKTMGLDLQLAALESLQKSKVISTPKIVTTDNMPAKISQGEDIPYAQSTAEGTISAAFKTVAITIEVTPHITPANSINMNISTTKEDFVSFVNIGPGSAPRTTKIEGKTNVLVQNGETIVIGGVYKKKETESSSGLPGLMKIPILGWLFKNRTKTEDISELMIFITPRIVEKQ